LNDVYASDNNINHAEQLDHDELRYVDELKEMRFVDALSDG
jgi:hypothetical protein